MAVTTPITINRGAKGVYNFVAAPVRDITGWALVFQLKEFAGEDSPALLQKSVGSGITVTDAAAGKFTLVVSSADTKSLTPNQYYWEVARTDPGEEDVLGSGPFIVNSHVGKF